ncbi:MAG: serine protease [Pleurocapsa sp.]
MICLVGTGMFLSGDASELKLKTLASVSPQKLPQEINQIAAEISVKILDQDFLGSGFVVQQSGRKYTVITNQHVLRAGKSPYRIETYDGKIYSAEIVSDLTATNYQYDLAVLSFEADANYPTAKIGNSLDLEVGEIIFAAGFPSQELELSTPAIFSQSNRNSSSRLALKLGRVAIVLNQALQEGYQIGYTNNVKKGMSGGPLLNSDGEVVGVNGKHAYPLWESPEVYQDGSEPCPALQELITRSSLAIPIEKSIELNPQLESLKIKSVPKAAREFMVASENSQLVARMQAEAAATTRSCQNDQRPEDIIDHRNSESILHQ